MMSLNSSPISHMKNSSNNFFSRQGQYKSFFQNDNADFFTFSNISSPPRLSEMVIEKNEEDVFNDNKMTSYEDPKIYFKNFNEGLHHSHEEENFFHNNLTMKDNMETEAIFTGFSNDKIKEEATSVSTKPSPMMAIHDAELEEIPLKLEENSMAQSNQDLETKAKALKLVGHKTKDEIEYIRSVLATLLRSCREVSTNGPELDDVIFEPLLLNLLESKKVMAERENQSIREMVADEINELTAGRPRQAIEEEDLGFNKRKVKKMLKGNKNSSSLNHVNENYVSNIFQFAKKNFPEDKEVRKIANERNVSASNFKKLMAIKLIDTAVVKRAKYRIMEGGRELLNNIEYWMNEGYFVQCNDREKYIAHKQKALYDLGLEKRIEIETIA